MKFSSWLSARLAIFFALIAGMMALPAFAQRPLGVDASNYQLAGVNWAQVATNGIVFAWMKATEQVDFHDADFIYNITNAKSAGIYTGAYHFAHPLDTTPQSQASYFWSFAGSYISGDNLSFNPMLDMEVFTGVNGGASSYGDWVNQWCDSIASNGISKNVVIRPFIYISACNASYLNNSVSQWLNDIASYNSEAAQTGTPWSSCLSGNQWGTTTTNWAVWQYNDTATYTGFPGEEPDVDVFNGTAAQLFSTLMVYSTNSTAVGPGMTLYWDPSFSNTSPGSGGTGTWNLTSTNFWRTTVGDGKYYQGGDYVVFGGPAGTVTLGTALSALGLTFSNAGSTIAGSTTLTLNGPQPIISVPTGTNTISCVLGGAGFKVTGGGTVLLSNAANGSGSTNSPITVVGPNTTLAVANQHDVGNSSVGLTLQSGGIYQDNDATSGDQFTLPASNVTLGSGGGIFYNPNGNLTMTNLVLGTGSLTTTGSSFTLTMNNVSNTYSGGTIVQSGTLKVSPGALGNVSGALTISGGTLNLNAGSHTNGAMTISSGTITSGTLYDASYAVQGGTVSAVLAGTGSVTKTTTNTTTFSGANSYIGNTTIAAGTLALASGGSINNSARITISAGATLDVSAITTFSLNSANSFTASGTATPATLKGGTTVNFGTNAILLTFDGVDPSLTISHGTLALNGNAFTVNGTQLPVGQYVVIQQTSGSISGAGTYSVAGTATGAAGTAASISVSGGSVLLTIAKTTSVALSPLTNSTYGQPVTFTATVSPSPSAGTVQFLDGVTALGSPVAVASNIASYPTSALSVGNHSITAAYSGATNYLTSTSSASIQTVSAAALSIAANPQTKMYGTALAFGSGSTNFTTTNLQNSETVGSVTLAVANNGGATNAPVGTYTITPSAATGGTFNPSNYVTSYFTGTLTVTLPSNSIPVTITSVTALTNGTIQLNFSGTPGYVYLIEAATDLSTPITWSVLATNAADTNGFFSYTDLYATNYTGRYYRTATQ